jgi:hypothetical protein
MPLGTAYRDLKHRARRAAIRVYDMKLRRQKRRQLQRHGYRALEDISSALTETGAVCFADFGTLLGIVRDGQIMAHDLDLDFGVLRASLKTDNQVRDQLIAMGSTLWRSYSVSGRLAAESYHYTPANGGGILKFDINYYDCDERHCRTWLFYHDPKQRYEKSELSVVELTYDRFDTTSTIDIKGQRVPVPVNAEKLLEQKYGAGWRQPDPSWIYWQSPAARPLAEREHYISHV